MICIVRTRTLHALRADRDEATMAAAALRAAREEQDGLVDGLVSRTEASVEDLHQQLATARAATARAEGELATLRTQHQLDTEDRVALRALLRTARKQAAKADRVYVLYRRGELHSVHASRDAAEEAAEAEGAEPSTWTTHIPDAALPPAAEVLWRIQPLPLGGVI